MGRTGTIGVLGSLVVAGLLIVALVRMDGRSGHEGGTLVVHCAAGLKPAVEAIARDYERETGVRVELHYAGSGTLLSGLRIRPVGDLYIAADDSYIELARDEGLVIESIPLASQRPVIAVRSDNPRNIRDLDDLLDVTFALADPDAAAIGRITQEAMQASGRWDRLAERCTVFKPTVNELANDVKLGSVDAAVTWDATLTEYPELQPIHVQPFEDAARLIVVGVLSCATQPSAAIALARYLGARDRGLVTFAERGFQTIEGDEWVERPELLLYAGSMFNQAIEQTIIEFERREGARVTRIYNGCGILVSQMHAGGAPDAYFSCDLSFLSDVQDRFLPATDVSENELVIVTASSNPLGIRSPDDLSRSNQRIGLAHAERSALGLLTHRLLEDRGILGPLRTSGSLMLEAPQGDFLVNQLRAGALDAAIVYRSNVAAVLEHVEVVPIEGEVARQPFAIARASAHRRTAARLLDSLRSERSQRRFRDLGFIWLEGRQ